MRFLALSLLLSAAPCAWAAPSGPSFSNLKLIESQPYGSKSQVVEIRGERGAPAPREWVYLLNDQSARGGVREVVVSDGKITSERTPLRGMTEVGDLKPLDPAVLNTDADAVFKKIQAESEKNEIAFHWIDYTLRIGGEKSAPIWSVRLYDNMGAVVGICSISAVNGAVLAGLKPDPEAKARAEATPPKDPAGGVLGGVGKAAERAAKSTKDSTLHFIGTLQETFVGERTIGPKEDE